MKKISQQTRRHLIKKARRGNAPAKQRIERVLTPDQQAAWNWRYNRIYNLVFGHGLGQVETLPKS